MSDFLKSALNYFNASDINVGCHDFVGQIVEVGSLKLKIKTVIAEGGFAFVYEAQDITQGNVYALKRLFGADKEACNNIIKEINLHKQVSDHPNIVKFIAASLVDRTKTTNGLAEYLLVTELCTGGSLLDYITDILEPENILRIFYQATQSIRHLHSQVPPITHRDIKIENFLLGSDGLLKLCDFGSATTDIIQPEPNWNANARNDLEDKLAMFTTPMYRAPEQLDTWENRMIGPKTDVWALGCILFYLCFQKHPFEDSAKLRIINGNFTLPSNSTYNCFHTVIKGCLQVNPDNRFDISTVLERIASLAETLNWNLKGPLKLKTKIKTASQVDVRITNVIPEHRLPPERPAEPPKQQQPPFTSSVPIIKQIPIQQHSTQQQHHHQQQQHLQHQQQQPVQSNGGLFSSLKGGAGSFLKNLKDTSSKVMQTVQQSMTKTDLLDISYITSRIIVMSLPTDGIESTYNKTNHIENIKAYLESKYTPSKISVYNFGARSTSRLPPPIRTVEGSFIYFPAPPRAPQLCGIYNLIEDMYGFLSVDPKSIIIIQSGDNGRATAATMVCALMIYGNLIKEPEDGLQMFAVKRMPPNIRPSELRYLYYLTDIVRTIPLLPHYKTITLVSLTVQPIPRMTRAKDGCRLFLEIICNDKIILNTLDDYDKMRLFHCEEGKITLSLNAEVCGDLCVTLYHARNSLGGISGRAHGIKICQFQLNTGFIPEEETLISYDKQELDDIHEHDQYSSNLNVSLSILVNNQEKIPSVSPPWTKVTKQQKRNPLILFSSDIEYQENVENFVTQPKSKSSTPPQQPHHQHHSAPVRPPPVRPPPSRPQPPSSPSQLHSKNVLPDIINISEEPKRGVTTTTEAFDLLSLNQNSTSAHQPQQQQQPPPPQKRKSAFQELKQQSFDLLGFGRSDDNSTSSENLKTNNNNKGSKNDLDNLLNTSNGTTNNTSLLGDLNVGPSIPIDIINSTQQQKSGGFDPFESLFQTEKPSSFNKEKIGVEPTPIITDPFADIAGFLSTGGNQTNNVLPSTSPSTSSNTTPTHQNRNNVQDNLQQQQKPDYNRSHFVQPENKNSNNNATAAAAAAANGTAQGKTGGCDIFADILGAQGYSFGKTIQQPRTINDMRKEDIVREMNPDDYKIMEWTEGKKNNIRALLCSMHTILWSEAKWIKCEMHQLVSIADVKRAYRKACLAVHPDKHVGTENEDISKMIFIELNNAWTDFENDSKQQNIFQS